MSIRNISYYIYKTILKNNISVDTICNYMNYNLNDYNRLITGRLSLSPDNIKKISKLLKIDIKELLHYKNNDNYYLWCICGKTNNEILDIIDSYIDFREVELWEKLQEV